MQGKEAGSDAPPLKEPYFGLQIRDSKGGSVSFSAVWLLLCNGWEV